jgi:hypothetical protein
MNLLDAATATTNAQFRARVAAAMVRTAVNVLGENAPDGASVEYETARQALAARVIRNYQAEQEPFVQVVAVNPAITDVSVTDQDIEFTINAAWDDVAGIHSGDRPGA